MNTIITDFEPFWITLFLWANNFNVVSGVVKYVTWCNVVQKKLLMNTFREIIWIAF